MYLAIFVCLRLQNTALPLGRKWKPFVPLVLVRVIIMLLVLKFHLDM